MQTPTRKDSSGNNAKPLAGVLLYENRDAYARALNLYAYLATKIAKEIPLEFSWWEFSFLKDQQNAKAAKAAVAVADLVIVSAQPAADWPHEFKMWIESWTLPKRKRLGALGALLSPPSSSDGICGRHAYLQYVAASLGIDFLTAAADPIVSQMKAKIQPVPKAADYEIDPTATIDRPVYSPYCGING